MEDGLIERDVIIRAYSGPGVGVAWVGGGGTRDTVLYSKYLASALLLTNPCYCMRPVP